MCIAFIPALLLSRPYILGLTKFYVGCVYFLEKYIANLDYEIRGKEYLPQGQSYIVAAKHQSAYETLKLHHLFGDPTIVLKRELLSLPLFGKFLKKLDVIPINRKNKEEAINSILEGAERMKSQKRPIVIFPQGTRVGVQISSKKKPYKGGIAKMYQNTDMSVVPLALNTGMYWSRNSFFKKPGKVIFEFLPPIEPGLPDKQVMKALEDRIEEKTMQLMHEAKTRYPYLETPPALPKPEEVA
ncbi:MAG: 1-acyl-sn-glycerol-3-phosphate acyltransferase [Alphaproteobacteria bacterium]|nr:1-acyl-sn-glycerol-3-phosphate acyltransferase [Alphaproteobacteria bacterium]